MSHELRSPLNAILGFAQLMETDVPLPTPSQKASIEQLYALEPHVKKIGDEQLLEDWRKLTTSDHFYYMCVKWFSDGDVHKYFNPYDTPYEGFITFMNALNDVTHRIRSYLPETSQPAPITEQPSLLLS